MEKREKAILNFKKAHSHLAKIIEMAGNKAYCIDVMQQNLAVIGLLKAAHESLMEGHLNTCFKNALAAKNDRLKQQMIEEILTVNKLYNK